MGRKSIREIETSIKRRLRHHLVSLGYNRDQDGLLSIPQHSKDAVRSFHSRQRTDKLKSERSFIKENAKELIQYFASGAEVDPARIRPRLQMIEADTMESDLFRFASLTWAVPVSMGYGRRMRFLVWDDYNGKLIGLIALGDPVFNLRVRDTLIGWTPAQRKDRLVCILDAYVLGALPPYNQLLGGKLVASLIRTQEMRELFGEKYGGTRGIISGKRKQAELVAVTTSSALGRSSIYNRLKLGGQNYFEPIGYTQGWGHFHVPDSLFDEMRNYLKSKRHAYTDNHQFGNGPNWKMRAIRTSLDLLGLDPDLLRHGISREVFLCKLAANAEGYLSGQVKKPSFKSLLDTNAVSTLALERWVKPRAERRPEYKDWNRSQILELIGQSQKSQVILADPAPMNVPFPPFTKISSEKSELILET